MNNRPRWTIVPRILCSLGFAVLAGALGLGQPFAWYWFSTVLEPGLFGSEYPLLVPLLLATIGGVGGGILGLLAGAVAPNRMGLALSFLGLALLHVAIGVYILVHPSSLVIALYWIIAPAIVSELILAGILCVLPTKRVR